MCITQYRSINYSYQLLHDYLIISLAQDKVDPIWKQSENVGIMIIFMKHFW